MAPVLQPGAQVDVIWKARLEDHLGTFTIEPVRSRSAAAMGDRVALAGLNAVTALLMSTLAERDPHPELYARTITLLDLLIHPEVWPLGYLRWEMFLLEDLGFALNLDSCAVTGSQQGLAYVSPRSGRAVSAEGAGEWASKLLPLPPVMRGVGDYAPAEIIEALGTTGHFVEHHLIRSIGGKPVPTARAAFVAAITRQSGA